MLVALTRFVLMGGLAVAVGAVGAPAVVAATPTVAMTRLSGDISGSLGVATAGVTVDVALERNHRTADGTLLEHHAVASATTTTDATGGWSVRLLHPWGGDPRDEVAVRFTGAPAGVGDLDVAALRGDGSVTTELAPSTVGWSTDGLSMNVDCGDTDMAITGACSAVSAVVVGRPGIATGAPQGLSPRLWQLTFASPLSIDDHVLLTETRRLTDSSGHAVDAFLSRDAGMPRGGDATVQRVPGVAPRCTVTLPENTITCLELDARGTYTANAAPLTYRPVTAAFDGRWDRSSATIAVRREGGSGTLGVLHVASRYGDDCTPGQWLGVVRVPSDLRRTRICPAIGRMSGVDVADAEVDELSGGWTAGSIALMSAPPPPPPPPALTPCAIACTVTVRSARVNAVMHFRSGVDGPGDGFMMLARTGTRTVRSLGRPRRSGGDIDGFAANGTRLHLGSVENVLTYAGVKTRFSATIEARRTRAGDPAITADVKRLAGTVRRTGRGTLRLDAPFAARATITLRRGTRIVGTRTIRLAQARSRNVVVRRRARATSIVVRVVDGLGNATRATARI